MSSTSPMFFEQPIVVFDTTEALNPTTGSFVLYGGVSVNSNYESSDVSTGSLVLVGGSAVQKNLSVGGVQTIYNSTDSTNTGDGALVVYGGVGIAMDLNVGGDTTITGNLYVNGTATYVNTQTLDIEDNTLVLNAGPAGSGDGGILIHRHGDDVTADVAATTGTGLTAGQTLVILPDDYDQSDNYYRGWWIETLDGKAQILSFSTGSREAFLATAGNTLPSSPTDTSFSLYNRSYISQYYAEASDELRFAYIADVLDINRDLENFGNYANVRFDTLYANTNVSTANLMVTSTATIANLALSTANLQSVTIGGLRVTGESVLHGFNTMGALTVTGESHLYFGVTAGSLNVTGESWLQGAVTAGGLAVTGASYFNDDMLITGGNLTVTGGSIIFNTVDVSPSMADIIKERSASIANNISVPEDVLTFSFDNGVARAFDAVVSVSITGVSGNKYAYYNLKGVQKTSNWVLNSSFVGDVTGITFSITNAGQIQYTTTDTPDFIDGVVKFRALTTTV